MKPLVLLGMGGHAKAVADVAAAAGRTVEGALANEAGGCPGIRLLGDDAWLDGPNAADHDYIIAVGHLGTPVTRIRLHGELRRRGLELATIVSPRACVSPTARIGAGTVVMHRCCVGPDASVGINCILNTGAIVEHDAELGEHVHLSTGAIVNGGARVGRGVFVGSGAVVLQGVTIADGAIVGAGCIVNRSLPEGGVYVGIPARKMR